MEKIIALLFTLIMIFSLAACGETDNSSVKTDDSGNNQQNTEVNSTDNNENNENNGDIAFTQKQYRLGYNIYCPEMCSVSSSRYGKTFTYENFSIILENPPFLENVDVIEGLDDVIEICKAYVCKSLESTTIFNTDSTEQTVSEQKTVIINGIDALRVVGTFKNTRNNTETDYVAYYMIGTDFDGRIYPVYIVGIPLDKDSSKLGDFMDDMASHIQIKE